MFSKMFASLETGELPSPTPLRQRLSVALIKKGGILQQPPACWSADPKSNPRAEHLLWASVILEDADSIGVATGYLILELQARLPQAHRAELAEALRARQRAPAALAPNENFRQILQAKIARAATICTLPELR